jgi:myo-inositol-1(or 4)-monophosphatase
MQRNVSLDLEHARAVATGAAEAAGHLLRAQAQRAFTVRSKGQHGDLVTDLDLASEKLIVSHLRNAFPEHRIITEEAGELAGNDSWTWLVDPLDGTNNLAIGLTAYGVGLALCQQGLPRVAVIHDVPRAMTWSATRGHGAHGPAGRLHPCQPQAPVGEQSLTIAWIQGHGVHRDDQTVQALTCRLESESKRVLRLWAPLLCWIMLARGDIDGIVLYRSGSIDLQAGTLIAQEAGVRVHELDGTPFDDHFSSIDEQRSLVAGYPGVVELLLELVQDIRPDVRQPRAPGGQGRGTPAHTSAGVLPVGQGRPV